MHWENMKRCLETVDAVYEQFPEMPVRFRLEGLGNA